MLAENLSAGEALGYLLMGIVVLAVVIGGLYVLGRMFGRGVRDSKRDAD